MANRAVLDGISVAIHEEYPKAHIYFGAVEQGLLDGDFILLHLHSEETPFANGRFCRRCSYQVVYFPFSPEDGLAVGDCLQEKLGVITVDGALTRAVQLTQETAEDTMQITVAYPYIYRTVQHSEAMEVLQRDSN